MGCPRSFVTAPPMCECACVVCRVSIKPMIHAFGSMHALLRVSTVSKHVSCFANGHGRIVSEHVVPRAQGCALSAGQSRVGKMRQAQDAGVVPRI